MREWLELSEQEFHEKITERMRTTGSIGDVIPAMITYNVPGFILKEIWPIAFEAWLAQPVFMAFAVAEDGWGGRIDNVDSKVTIEAGPDGAGAGGARLEFAKSYVIDCETILILARAEHAGPEEFALCRVPRRSEQVWESRGDPGVLLDASDGTEVDHYRVRGTEELEAGDVLPISRKKYTPLGIRIPRRELSSLAVISAAQLEHLDLRPAATSDRDLLEANAKRIVDARVAGRLSGNEMRAAVDMLDVFFKTCEEARAQVHPFWEKVRIMRDRFDR